MFGLWLALGAAASELTGGSTVLWRTFASFRALKVGQALGAGFLLALGITELLPEGLAEGGSPLLTLAGFLFLMLVEGWLGHRHHGHVAEDAPADVADPGRAVPPATPAALRPAARPAVAGRAAAVATWAGAMICAFSDGVSIASAGSAGAAIGLLVFIGYLPHKMFEGFTLSAVLAGAGIARARAAVAAGLLGGSTLLGAVVALVALRFAVGLGQALLVSAGIVLNLAASELIPELREEGERRHLYLVLLGAAVYTVTVALLRTAGLG